MGGASSSVLVHGFSWLYGSSGGEIELRPRLDTITPAVDDFVHVDVHLVVDFKVLLVRLNLGS